MTHLSSAFANSLAAAEVSSWPYRHWLLTKMFPDALVDELERIDFAAPDGVSFGGRRECNNSTRVFADAIHCAAHPSLAQLAALLKAPETIATIERTCGIDLAGTYLRIEYCLDTDGFWLEPHTDIGAKRFTMLCYLSVGEGSDPCGTDVLDGDYRVVARAPFERNSGLIFIPGPDTWHGFAPRRINGVRKTLMVNYVGEEWRARHELAFADPVK